MGAVVNGSIWVESSYAGSLQPSLKPSKSTDALKLEITGVSGSLNEMLQIAEIENDPRVVTPGNRHAKVISGDCIDGPCPSSASDEHHSIVNGRVADSRTVHRGV